MYYNLNNILSYITKNKFIVKKKMGQNFLWSEPNIKKIIKLIKKITILEKPTAIIEIGPGFGALTQYLLELKYRVFCIEYDYKLVSFLQKKFLKFILNKQLIIFYIDIEKISLYSLIKVIKGPVIICGNLPYYLSKNIINKIMALGVNLIKVIFLIQQETTDKIIINSKNNTYNISSAKVQFIFKTNFSYIFDKFLFYPVPKVNGSIITLIPHIKYNFYVEWNIIKKIINTIFIKKRKLLKNSLKEVPFLLSCYYICNFDIKKRVNFLKIGDLFKLARILNFKIKKKFSIDKYYY